MHDVRAIFLDFDGTLANSIEVMSLAYTDFLALYNISQYHKSFNDFKTAGAFMADSHNNQRRSNSKVSTISILL